jgi:uncharacterized protein
MSHQPVIDAAEFAAAGAKQQGVFPLSGFPRLRDVLTSDAGEIAYEIEGARDARGRPGLRIRVRGTLALRCQRCLEPMRVDVSTDELLVLAASQAEIDAEPADVDAPDRVVAAEGMAVLELVEDELILAVPYAPRHPDCAGRAPAGEAEKALPFAHLRGLMRDRH